MWAGPRPRKPLQSKATLGELLFSGHLFPSLPFMNSLPHDSHFCYVMAFPILINASWQPLTYLIGSCLRNQQFLASGFLFSLLIIWCLTNQTSVQSLLIIHSWNGSIPGPFNSGRIRSGLFGLKHWCCSSGRIAEA